MYKIPELLTFAYKYILKFAHKNIIFTRNYMLKNLLMLNFFADFIVINYENKRVC